MALTRSQGFKKIKGKEYQRTWEIEGLVWPQFCFVLCGCCCRWWGEERGCMIGICSDLEDKGSCCTPVFDRLQFQRVFLAVHLGSMPSLFLVWTTFSSFLGYRFSPQKTHSTHWSDPLLFSFLQIRSFPIFLRLPLLSSSSPFRLQSWLIGKCRSYKKVVSLKERCMEMSISLLLLWV
jgi:hypothetical protein